jgi:hypothetical protein
MEMWCQTYKSMQEVISKSWRGSSSTPRETDRERRGDACGISSSGALLTLAGDLKWPVESSNSLSGSMQGESLTLLAELEASSEL